MGKWYPPEFEEVWRAFNTARIEPKGPAYAAFKAAEIVLPENTLLLKCIESYEDWIAVNAVPKVTLNQWLNESMWMPYLADAANRLGLAIALYERKEAMNNATGRTWPATTLARLGLSDHIIDKWFRTASLIHADGCPPEIRCPNKAHAEVLLNRWHHQIERALGPETAVTYL